MNRYVKKALVEAYNKYLILAPLDWITGFESQAAQRWEIPPIGATFSNRLRPHVTTTGLSRLLEKITELIQTPAYAQMLRKMTIRIVIQTTVFRNNGAPKRKLRVALIGQSTFAAEVFKLLQKDGHEVNADINVLPFCTQFIPMEVITHPKYQSICYHPSILPRHRGDSTCGLSIFWADDGLDTGPILLQKSFPVTIDDTVDTIYNKYLYPEATSLVAPQTREGITEGDNIEIKFYGSSLWQGEYEAKGDQLILNGLKKPAVIHEAGLLITANDGVKLNIQRLRVNGKMINAQNYYEANENKVTLELTPEEAKFVESVRDCGAGSMDVVRLVEEVKDLASLQLQNEDVYMNTTFQEFYSAAVSKARGGAGDQDIIYEGVEMEINKMKIKFPTQLFINGEFVNADSGKTLPLVNPSDESVICQVQSASANDVDKAVRAAKKAFEEGELADLMEQHKEELATIEREPIGVCALVTPWNYPLMMLSWKMAACVSADSPQVRGAVCEGRHPAGRHQHPAGQRDGQTIMKSCAASNMKKVSLELGGKSPLGMGSVFFNKGENCIAAGRLFVEETIHDEFVRRVVEETNKIAIGDPLHRGTNMDEVIRRANNTEYGLASGVFTKDVSRALQFAEKIEAGTVFVNTYNKTDVKTLSTNTSKRNVLLLSTDF
ncbi:putative aldehyde dehydrogenase [Operophtera brumata]|uniref:Putative aldehyde dehydrogenase n=1 Tax=Operophtera brumata TaxID=104452 RepID=A0A0L7LK15_OPEBR|nr:putative aldehyde dehydrogenase [Operophtera brumata]